MLPSLDNVVEVVAVVVAVVNVIVDNDGLVVTRAKSLTLCPGFSLVSPGSLNRSDNGGIVPVLSFKLLFTLFCLGTGLRVTDEGGGMRLVPLPAGRDDDERLLDCLLDRLTEVRLTPGRLARFTDDPETGLRLLLLLLLIFDS